MKIRRKTDICLNCGSSLDGTYNYCPKCGQENQNNNVSFKMLLGDFFNTYLAIDSRFAKSFKPFLIQPGRLTNEYVKGKRMSYAHPVRLYLIISVFYFFILSKVGPQLTDDNASSIDVNDNLSKNPQKDSLVLELTGISRDSLMTLDSIYTEENRGLVDQSKNETIKSYQDDSYNKSSSKTLPNIKSDKNEEDDNGLIFERVNWSLVTKYKLNKGITDNQLYDSVKVSNMSDWDEKIVRQTIRVMRSDREQLTAYIINNLPLMMLVLIPIFALILKLLYLRNKEHFYIKHIIHTLHLHSFAYLFFGINLLIINYFIDSEEWFIIYSLAPFIIVAIYTFTSFRKVYEQRWFKTLIKFLFTGFSYTLFIFAFFIVEMLVSLWLF